MSLSKPDLTEISVPAWVHYVAQDSDGSWWGYSVEPLQNHRGWYENELGENIKLAVSAACENWRNSLLKTAPCGFIPNACARVSLTGSNFNVHCTA